MKCEAGKVYLIGAGPGDPELLTLKAARVLATADVVLIDDLVNRRVLAHARADVRVIYVGKRGGCKSTPQAFVERKLVQLARQGCIVARVKGGDPFVFGRGGEEAEALRSAGIDCEIVNGITSGIAAPAAIGVPVTHRDCSHGVTFVTGHPRKGRQINWRALAASGTTLVIYMGVARIESIVAELLDAGMPPRTLAAAITNGTLKTQRTVIATLADFALRVRAAAIASPAIFVIGDVVRYARTAAAVAETQRAA